MLFTHQQLEVINANNKGSPEDARRSVRQWYLYGMNHLFLKCSRYITSFFRSLLSLSASYDCQSYLVRRGYRFISWCFARFGYQPDGWLPVRNETCLCLYSSLSHNTFKRLASEYVTHKALTQKTPSRTFLPYQLYPNDTWWSCDIRC